MKIIVDAMGGDHAPQAIVQGALEAHKTHGVEILLVGRAAEVLRAGGLRRANTAGRRGDPGRRRGGGDYG